MRDRDYLFYELTSSLCASCRRKVEAKVVGHERGPKIRVLKFKPKRGYKRRTGHRQELTRLEVTEVKMLSRRPAQKKTEEADDGA